jgi:Domain of unknown function (DUF4352)
MAPGIIHTSRTRLCAGCVLALLTALALAPGLRVHAQGASHLLIAARYVESVPLDMMGKPTREELFIYVDVRYSGADVLQLSPQNFRLADASGVEHSPQSYDGADPLKPEDLLGTAHIVGWLLFTMPKGTRNLSLVYQQSEQTQSGITLVTLLARTAPFTPRPNLTRLYAANAQRALDAYLRDEALAAGYIRMEVNPLYTDGGNGALPGDVRARLEHLHAVLRQDHQAFDRVAAPTAAARRLKSNADRTFTAIEGAIAAAPALRRYTDWRAWNAALARDDRALADLYQIWPGPQ